MENKIDELMSSAGNFEDFINNLKLNRKLTDRAIKYEQESSDDGNKDS